MSMSYLSWNGAPDQAGRRFRVVVADARTALEGRRALSRLLAAGIPTTYVLLNALSYTISVRHRPLLPDWSSAERPVLHRLVRHRRPTLAVFRQLHRTCPAQRPSNAGADSQFAATLFPTGLEGRHMGHSWEYCTHVGAACVLKQAPMQRTMQWVALLVVLSLSNMHHMHQRFGESNHAIAGIPCAGVTLSSTGVGRYRGPCQWMRPRPKGGRLSGVARNPKTLFLKPSTVCCRAGGEQGAAEQRHRHLPGGLPAPWKP